MATRRSSKVGGNTEKVCDRCGTAFVTMTSLTSCRDCNMDDLLATAARNVARRSPAARRLGMTK